MSSKLIKLKRPKYHPVTGVELDESYNFEFDKSEDTSRISELTNELQNSRSICLELRDDRRSLLDQVKQLQLELLKTNRDMAYYKRMYDMEREIKKRMRQFKRDKRILKYQLNGKVTRALINDLTMLKNKV